MVKTVKMQNTLSRVYNGIKPRQIVNVDEASVPFYESNGFIKVTDAIENARKEEQANQEAEAIANAEVAQEAQVDGEREKAQEELDAEYQGGAEAVATSTGDVEKAGHDASTDVEALTAELENAPAPKKSKAKA